MLELKEPIGPPIIPEMPHPLRRLRGRPKKENLNLWGMGTTGRPVSVYPLLRSLLMTGITSMS